MAPKPQIWTEDAEFKLIHEVQQRALLWNVRDTNYKRTDLKNGHWDEIAKALGPQFDCETVKKRFTNMKDTWMDNNRKVRDSKNRCSGKGAEEIFKPRWKCFDSMSFLSKAAAQSSSVDSLSYNMPCGSPSSSIQEIQIYHDDTLNQFVMIPEDMNIDSPMTSDYAASPISSIKDDKVPSFMPPPSEKSTLPERPVSTPLPYSKKENVKNDEFSFYDPRGSKKRKTDVTSEALEVIKNFAEKDSALIRKDSLDHFGSFVAARLRAADAKSRQQMEFEIFSVLNRFSDKIN